MAHHTVLLLVVLAAKPIGIGSPVESATAFETESVADLRQNVGRNKIIPREIERQCLVALAHFPELEATRIEFKRTGIKQSLAARPRLSDILQRRKKRGYTVLINNRSSFGGLLFEKLPEPAQVGILAHELVHLVDYQRKPWWRLAWQGVRYTVSQRYRRKVEREADRQTVARGLGEQLHCFSSRVLQSPDVEEAYRSRRRALYLSPEEIAASISGKVSRLPTALDGRQEGDLCGKEY